MWSFHICSTDVCEEIQFLKTIDKVGGKWNENFKKNYRYNNVYFSLKWYILFPLFGFYVKYCFLNDV